MKAEDVIVDARKISKAYLMGSGIVTALCETTLLVNRGECLGIMGPSGSGKSTLMHLLGCLDRPSKGSYLLNGIDVSQLDDKELSLIRATQIGFVFQSFNLISQLNVVENVEIPFLYQATPHKSMKEAVINALELVGLSHRLHHLPKELSGGEMQRVAIARALAINPLLILADEPTGNLDFETGRSVLSLFQKLNNKGVTIIIVTHDEFVGKHCKRIIKMRDGRIIGQEFPSWH